MKYIAYIFIILVGILAVAEIGFRTSGAYRTYSEKTTGKFYTDAGKESQNRLKNYPPNSNFEIDHGEFHYTYYTNGFGFREREVPLENYNKPKVFVFGDSFTDGVGAAADSTWPRFMERLMQEEYEGAGVYTFATSGSDPFYNFATLQTMVPMEPTHVIFTINETDLNDHIIRGGFERYTDSGVKFKEPPPFYNLYRYSHLFRFVLIEFMDYDHNLNRKSDYDKLRRKAASEISNCLHQASQLCWSRNIKFLVVSHPVPKPVCMGANPSEQDVAIFGKYIANLPFVQISERLTDVMQQSDCSKYYWPIDGHFNKYGYELMAETVYELIQSEYPDYFQIYELDTYLEPK